MHDVSKDPVSRDLHVDLHRTFEHVPLRPIITCVSRVTLEKRSRGVHPTSSDTPRCPSRAYSIGCAIWLVAWVRVYKRSSSVSFRIYNKSIFYFLFILGNKARLRALVFDSWFFGCNGGACVNCTDVPPMRVCVSTPIDEASILET